MGGGGGETPPVSYHHPISKLILDISGKEYVTVILLLGVSYIVYSVHVEGRGLHFLAVVSFCLPLPLQRHFAESGFNDCMCNFYTEKEDLERGMEDATIVLGGGGGLEQTKTTAWKAWTSSKYIPFYGFHQ